MKSLDSIFLAVRLLSILLALGVASRYYSPRIRFWRVFLLASFLTGLFFWPEDHPEWQNRLIPFLFGKFLLGLVALLEALQWQTRRSKNWTRLMGGAFTVGGAVAALCWVFRGATWSDSLIELRRYGQMWAGAVGGIVQLTLWSTPEGWGESPEGWHALFVSGLAMAHSVVSVLYLSGRDSMALWRAANAISAGVDAGIFLAWSGFWIFLQRSRESRP